MRHISISRNRSVRSLASSSFLLLTILACAFCACRVKSAKVIQALKADASGRLAALLPPEAAAPVTGQRPRHSQPLFAAGGDIRGFLGGESGRAGDVSKRPWVHQIPALPPPKKTDIRGFFLGGQRK